VPSHLVRRWANINRWAKQSSTLDARCVLLVDRLRSWSVTYHSIGQPQATPAANTRTRRREHHNAALDLHVCAVHGEGESLWVEVSQALLEWSANDAQAIGGMDFNG
jgi:hypothetical protein